MEERVWQLQQQLASAGAIDITGLVLRDACIVRTARYPACSGRALHAELRAELEKRCSDAAERQLRCEDSCNIQNLCMLGPWQVSAALNDALALYHTCFLPVAALQFKGGHSRAVQDPFCLQRRLSPPTSPCAPSRTVQQPTLRPQQRPWPHTRALPATQVHGRVDIRATPHLPPPDTRALECSHCCGLCAAHGSQHAVLRLGQRGGRLLRLKPSPRRARGCRRGHTPSPGSTAPQPPQLPHPSGDPGCQPQRGASRRLLEGWQRSPPPSHGAPQRWYRRFVAGRRYSPRPGLACSGRHGHRRLRGPVHRRAACTGWSRLERYISGTSPSGTNAQPGGYARGAYSRPVATYQARGAAADGLVVSCAGGLASRVQHKVRLLDSRRPA